MKFKNILFFSTFFISLIGSSQISTDRPGASDAATTVMKGSFQLEQGFGLSFYSQDTLNYSAFGMPTSFRIGVAKWLELRVINQVQSIKTKNTGEVVFGIADLLIGFKAQLLRKENINAKIALVSMWGMPIGTEGITTGKFSANNKLSLSHQLSKMVGMTYNIGYSYAGSGNGNLNYTMLFGFQIVKKLFVFIENFGSYINFRDFRTSADAGIAYRITDWVQIDLSFGAGINHRYNYTQIGVSWNIHKKDKTVE